MPPPRGFSPAYYEPPPAPPPPQIPPPVAIAPEPPATVEAVAGPAAVAVSSPPVQQQQPIAAQTEQPVEASDEAPAVPKEEAVEQSESVQDAASTEAPAPEVSDSPTPVSTVESQSVPALTPVSVDPPSTTYTMGSISNNPSTDANIPLSPTQFVSSTRSHSHKASLPSPVASIAIWSRRPGDPSKAPGIIISPRARPPSDIVQKALDARTPPASPKSILVALPEESIEEKEKAHEQEQSVETQPGSLSVQDKDVSASGIGLTSVTDASRIDSTISSSAVTEVTDAPTLPGSPISTNTSISVTGGTPVKDAGVTTTAGTIPAVVVDGKTNTTSTVTATTSAAGVSTSTSTTPVASTSKTPEPESKSTATSAPASSSSPVPAPAPAPTAPSAPKSWASLFSSPASSSTHQRGALPTSSVVGISIPAPSTSTSTPAIAVAPAKKSELLSLLTNGPSGASASAVQRIRTRGLINSGNMCFANAVLQVLVYCHPFQRLFIELGRLLGKEGERGGSVNGNGNAGGGKPVKSQTPFIDATVEFLKEFVEEERERKKKDGAFGFSGKGGKGKEKEVLRDEDGAGEEDEWPESFLPSYFYEAMKEKKRFESMRVSVFFCLLVVDDD